MSTVLFTALELGLDVPRAVDGPTGGAHVAEGGGVERSVGQCLS